MEAFEFFEVTSPYSCYPALPERQVGRYTGNDEEGRRSVERGVPQSSVLGPILWIISYDAMLRCLMPPDTGMASNAGDTLFLAGGRWWHETLHHNKFIVACAMRAIRRLGMRVFAAKSEAIWFYDWRPRGLFCPTCVRI